VLLILVLQVSGGLMVGLLSGLMGLPLGEHPLTLGVINLVSMAFALGLALAVAGRPVPATLGLRGFSWAWCAPICLTVAGMHFVASDLANAMLYLLPPPEHVTGTLELLLGLNERPWSAAVTLIIIAPAGEELVFRGVILDGLRRRYRAAAAVFLSALLFAVMHANPWQIPPTFVIGLVFGWWRLRGGSIYPCILGHALHNALAWLAGQFLPVDIPGYNADPAAGEIFQPWRLTSGGALAACAGLAGFALLARGASRARAGLGGAAGV
jgi:membrane protease YdiL (CAAX protease family)